MTLSPDRSGTFELSVTCQGYSCGPLTAPLLTLRVLPPAPPTVAISLNPNPVVAGEALNVSWTSNGTTSCTPAGGGMPGGFLGCQHRPRPGAGGQ